LAKRGAQVVALDLSPTAVEMARTRVQREGVSSAVELRVQAAEECVAHGDRFDVVLGNGVLHHLDLRAFKGTLTRLLRPEGIAQFQEPLIHNPLLRMYRLVTPHLRTPTERPLSMEVVENFVAGFSDVRVEFFNALGLGLVLMPRVLSERTAQQWLSRCARWDRRMIGRWPWLRRYAQYVVIQMRCVSESNG